MANVFVNIPVPVANGPGAAVNVSTLGSPKTITLQGDLAATVNIEISEDAGITWATIATFFQPGKKILSFAAQFMRAAVTSFKSGTANADVSANDNGALFFNLPALAGDGVGVAINVSTLGTLNTAVIGGPFRGTVLIEISEDGIDWAQCFSFTAPGEKSRCFTAQFMRTRRSGVPVINPGLPVVDVGAVRDATVGAIGTTLQDAYDNSIPALIILDAVNGPVQIRDNAVPLGNLFEVEDSTSIDLFAVSPALIEANATLVDVSDRLRVSDATASVLLDVADVAGGGIDAFVPMTWNSVIAPPVGGFSVTVDDTFATGAGAFIGGAYSHTGTIDIETSVFVWLVLSETAIYNQTVALGFSAFVLFQAFETRTTELGAFPPLSSLVLNIGGVTENLGAGAGLGPISFNFGISFSPQTRARVAGDVMDVTAQVALRSSPTFSTVSFSTAGLGAITAVQANTPAVALFQPAAGFEGMTSYFGLEYSSMAFGGNVPKEVVRSSLPAASLAFFLRNLGGAQSNFGGGTLLDCGQVQIDSDLVGLVLGEGQDIENLFDGALWILDPVIGDDFRIQFLAGRQVIDSDAAAEEVNWGHLRYAWGQTTGNGNQICVWISPAFTVPLAGEWSSFLDTVSADLDINGLAMSNVDSRRLNPLSIALSGGTIIDITTHRINGMTTVGIGTAETSAQFVAGRNLVRGTQNYPSLTPADLTVDVNDYAPATGNSDRYLYRLSTDDLGVVRITGLAVQRTGDEHKFINYGTVDGIEFSHQDVLSAASNRFITPDAVLFTLAVGEGMFLWHDDVDDRWRIRRL